MIKARNLFVIFCTAFVGCASAGRATTAQNDPAPQVSAKNPRKSFSERWSRRFDGFITDLNVSKNGRRILMATAPDRESGTGSRRYQMILLDRTGRTLRKEILKSPIRTQAISDDGKLLVLSNYENQLIGISTSGARRWSRWSTEAMCKPIPLNRSKKILCYHDEDADSDVAFEVFGWNGKKILSFPIGTMGAAEQVPDVLALKVSEDERNVAMALTRGQLILIGPDFHSRWRKKLEGEIQDVSVSSGPEPKVAVIFLTRGPNPIQKIAVFDAAGRLAGERTAGSPGTAPAKGPARALFEQIEITPSGNSVLTYGNTAEGQYVNSYRVTNLEEGWRERADSAAEYSSVMQVFEDHVAIAFDTQSAVRNSHLRLYRHDGELDWEIPLDTKQGAYLAAFRFVPVSRALFIALDDGRLSAVRLKD
ncbi:MAG: hypothetical protein A2428_15935 [Bdellovibrionales bacterium RIFOXYC1_FULL_54_43]|nr:MAG: hypothetical protein A2428_15935 [Bdellovibrionales bacterium RIFOXYC1_FULL_54_43]OFZ84639.1 MAG: hypothetical protein A2603_12230 [Bdellovibrionales bacterium RIFOXYD1_FULL_55_31]